MIDKYQLISFMESYILSPHWYSVLLSFTNNQAVKRVSRVISELATRCVL